MNEHTRRAVELIDQLLETADDDPGGTGWTETKRDALIAHLGRAASDAQEDRVRDAIRTEKLLCDALGRPWSPSGFSIETLIADMKGRLAAARATTQPTEQPPCARCNGKGWIEDGDPEIGSASIDCGECTNTESVQTDQPADRVSMPFDAFQIRSLTAQVSSNGDAHELSGDGIYRFAQCLWDAFITDQPADRERRRLAAGSPRRPTAQGEPEMTTDLLTPPPMPEPAYVDQFSLVTAYSHEQCAARDAQWQSIVAALIERAEKAEAALAWYGDEARALAKHMQDGVHESALLASLTVLALDAGRRAYTAKGAA